MNILCLTYCKGVVQQDSIDWDILYFTYNNNLKEKQFNLFDKIFILSC